MQWQREYLKALEEYDARAKQAARDNPTRYGVKRVEEALQEYGGALMPVLKPVEHSRYPSMSFQPLLTTSGLG